MKVSQNFDDALVYVKAYNRKKHDEFLSIVIDLKLKRGGRRIATRVKRLFKGHSDLILGFNTRISNQTSS
jgi:histone deacetylase complex regulatory component SIN3